MQCQSSKIHLDIKVVTSNYPFFMTVTCPFIIFDKMWWKKYFVSNFKGSKKWTQEYFKIVTNVGAFK